MYDYNKHLHFIGIGGVGMAGIAEVLLNKGYSVSGSDIKRGFLVKYLESLGVTISIGHSASNIPNKTSVVVISSAIEENNEELIGANKRNIPVISRAEMLAEIMRMKYGISIAGSHGKTTTTSMTAKILTDSGLDPTVIIGGRFLSKKSGAHIGRGEYVVAEADESDGSFCLLRPAISVVTNIDMEHLGHYGTFGALEDSFYRFMQSVPFYGVVIACADDPVVSRVIKKITRRVITYGTSPHCDLRASNIRSNGRFSTFNLEVFKKRYENITIPVLGTHLVKNALASIAVGVEVGVYVDEAICSLKDFEGVSRRSELVKEKNGIKIFDDYAHHPTEIRATLRAIKASWIENSDSSKNRLIVLFEPHRYSRTKELFSDFLTSFSDADILIVGDIYSAGEKKIEGINSENLVKAIEHKNVTYSRDLLSSFKELLPELSSGDVVVTLGAGSIGEISSKIGKMLVDF